MHSPRRSVSSRIGTDAARNAGNSAPDKIAVLRRRNPARDQCERDRALAGRERCAFHGVLEIQQAEIILAALAQDRLLVALLRIGIELRRLLKDLALQIARVGRNPEAGSVALRPQRGGREIAERLSRARSRFDKRDARRARAHARREGWHRGAGEFALLLSCAAVADDGGLQARLRASSSIACWLGRPAGASSSHSARPRQESKPASGASARSGSPSTARTDGPQRQPAFTIWLAALRARSFSSGESFSNPSSSVPAAICNIRAEFSAVCGSLDLQRAGKPERAWKARFARAARTRKARARHTALSPAARRSAR